MAKVYYMLAGGQSEYAIWSIAKTLTEAGAALAKQNRVWPSRSSDGKLFIVGKKPRGERSVIPTGRYRLEGDKLKKIGGVFSI